MPHISGRVGRMVMVAAMVLALVGTIYSPTANAADTTLFERVRP